MIAIALQAAVALAVAGLAAACCRRAASRHHAWLLGIVAVLLLPLFALVPLRAAAGSWVALPATLVVPAVARTASVGVPWLALWAIGAALVAARFARSHLAAYRLVRGATPDGYAEDVPILRSAAIASPMTVGILVPRILLPVGTPAARPALLHELGHVGRRDALAQLLGQLVCALHWFDPLAWWAARRLRVEREHACDDLVLAGGILPSSYACDLLAAGGHHDAICMGGATQVRLRRLLDATVPRRALRSRTRLAASLVAIAATGLLACSDRLAVSAGVPSLRGGDGAIDLAGVGAEVARHLPELASCYHGAAHGTVVVHAAITPSGEVVDQCITEDTVEDPEVVDCVNALVTNAHFPAPAGTVDVTIPFEFGG